MLDRPGARRWIKLALLLAGSFAVLFVGYASYRVASVPSLDPARDAELFTFPTPTSVPESENAAALYRNADPTDRGNVFRPRAVGARSNRVLARKAGTPRPRKRFRWYRESASELATIRKAAALPYCRFEPIETLTVFTPVGNDSALALAVRPCSDTLGSRA